MPNYYFYILFLLIIIISITVDIVTQKENTSIKKAIWQFIIWIVMASIFCVILLFYKNKETALNFAGGYLVELSLSIDNIFVFIIIFNQYKIESKYTNKLLLVGILLAIFLRVIFITLGVGLLNKFEWIIYLFGPILIWTGIQIMVKKESNQIEEVDNKFIKFIKKNLRYTSEKHNGHYFIKKNKKIFLTTLSLTALILAVIDIVFALDSIPTIISLIKSNPSIPFNENEILVIYSSNIFAVLGLRALFFILLNMSNKFEYLQKAIGIILMFIGLKMILDFFHIHISFQISLGFIIITLVLGVLLSKIKNK